MSSLITFLLEVTRDRILVPLDINNKYPTYFFSQKCFFLNVYIINLYIMVCIRQVNGRLKFQNVNIIANGVLRDVK